MPSWPLDAACRGLPTAWWYADEPQVAALAMEVCSRCGVRRACLDAALAEEGRAMFRYGVRGGLTPRARRRLSKARPAAGTIDVLPIGNMVPTEGQVRPLSALPLDGLPLETYVSTPTERRVARIHHPYVVAI